MTQYIRPGQAYAAVAAAVAQAASSERDNHRFLHNRFAAALGIKAGAQTYGSLKAFNTTERYLLVPDTVYAAAVAGGIDLTDALYNSNTPPGTLSTTSDVPTLAHMGLRRQAIIAVGDSRTNSAIGSVSPNAQDQMWAQGIAANGLATYYSPTTSSEKSAMNYRWAHEKSRVVFNFGRDSNRLVNQSGFTYTAGYNWLDNINQMTKLVVPTGQQLVIAIHDSNDIPYADTNGNPGMGSVPAGTAGAVYGTTINYIDSVLKPFITAIRAAYSGVADLKVVHCGMWARNGTNLCAKNVEVMAYLKANKAAVGLDWGIDTTQIAHISPTDVNNPNDTGYYQGDGVHFLTAANALMNGPKGALYDKCLGFTPAPAYAALIY